MKKIILFTFCIICFASCAKEEKQGYILRGTLIDTNTRPYEGYVYLRYENTKDSVLAVNNTFEFTGSVEKPIQASVHLKGNSINAWVYLENSEIEGKGKWWTSNQNNRDYNLFQFDTLYGSKSQAIQTRFFSFIENNPSEENKAEQIYQELKAIATEHPTEPVVGTIFATQSANTTNQLNYDQVHTILQIIDTTVMHKGDMQMINLAHQTMKLTAIGNVFPKFDLIDNKEGRVSLEQFKGKITLIDFWASWCAPCRAKHPKLIDFYQKNKDKDFAIVSISDDRKKENWTQSIQEDDLNYWPNAWDEGSKLNKEVGIMAIPYSYLLDKDGKIMGKNLSFQQIQTILNE